MNISPLSMALMGGALPAVQTQQMRQDARADMNAAEQEKEDRRKRQRSMMATNAPGAARSAMAGGAAQAPGAARAMRAGGVVRGDGCARKGKTRGKVC